MHQLIHEIRNGFNGIAAAADALESADPASDTAAEARTIIARQVRALAHRLAEGRRAAP